MSDTQATALAFITIETIETTDTTIRLCAYDASRQTMMIVRTWQIDGGDHEQFEACQLEAENIAAYWIESLLDVDYFDFGGITIHGWPVNARLRAETDPLAVIAADATQL